MPPKPRSKPAKKARRIPPSDSRMRLPHEQDESSRHRAQPAPRVMKTAHDDVAEGLVDTDQRGNAARAAFEKKEQEDRKRASTTARDSNATRRRRS
jgi:hypothetical protein